jgi:hypothetical protein
MKNIKLLRLLLSLIYFGFMTNHSVAETMMKDNFQDSTQWEYISDNVMGGVSTGNVEFENVGGKSSAVLTGNVTTENNGGFIQIRRNLNSVNLDKAHSIKLIAKGNKQKYYVFLRTTETILPWQYYQSSFTVTEDFNAFFLPIEKFKKSGFLMSSKINPRKITSVGLVAFGRDHHAELIVQEIEFIE